MTNHGVICDFSLVGVHAYTYMPLIQMDCRPPELPWPCLQITTSVCAILSWSEKLGIRRLPPVQPSASVLHLATRGGCASWHTCSTMAVSLLPCHPGQCSWLSYVSLCSLDGEKWHLVTVVCRHFAVMILVNWTCVYRIFPSSACFIF